MSTHDPREHLPDIRDGLTQRERILLQRLSPFQRNVLGNRWERSAGQEAHADHSC